MEKSNNYLQFKDLYNYIQTADRDRFGIHKPFKDSDVAFHIYSGNVQVNMMMGDVVLLDFVFDPDDEYVSIYSVEQGIADYEHPLMYPTSSYINGPQAHWYSEISIDVSPIMVKNILTDVLLRQYVNVKTINNVKTSEEKYNELRIIIIYLYTLMDKLKTVKKGYVRDLRHRNGIDYELENNILDLCNEIIDISKALLMEENVNILNEYFDDEMLREIGSMMKDATIESSKSDKALLALKIWNY